MADTERRARGKAVFQAVYGDVLPLKDVPVGDVYIDNMFDQLFAEVWSREVLSMRDRRLLVLGALAAGGEAEMAEVHLRSALGNGELTADQAREVLIFMIHYIGYPKGARLHGAIERAIAGEPRDPA